MTTRQLIALRIADPSTWRKIVLRTLAAQEVTPGVRGGTDAARMLAAARALGISESTIWRWLAEIRANAQ